MNIRVAKTAGFCYGVNRAVGLVEKAIADGKKTVTLGPIAHNRHLVQHFETLGAREVHGIDDISEGTTVVIRSHGIPKAMYDALRQKNIELIDATCPSV